MTKYVVGGPHCIGASSQCAVSVLTLFLCCYAVANSPKYSFFLALHLPSALYNQCLPHPNRARPTSNEFLELYPRNPQKNADRNGNAKWTHFMDEIRVGKRLHPLNQNLVKTPADWLTDCEGHLKWHRPANRLWLEEFMVDERRSVRERRGEIFVAKEVSWRERYSYDFLIHKSFDTQGKTFKENSYPL